MTVDRSNLYTDLYTDLGLTRQATPEQVKHAYRALLRKHHPDTRPPGSSPSAPHSDAALQHVLAAYAVLGDPSRRAAYDRTLEPPGPSASTSTGTLLRTPG